MKIAEVINTGRDGDRHFNPDDPKIQDAKNPMSRSALVYMSPNDFLSVVPRDYVPEKLERTRQLAAQGIPFRDIPFLTFTHDGQGNAKVYDHEGRHRSQALSELGIQQMPVILRSISGGTGHEIRWGRQQADSRDRVPVLPRVLHGEDKRNSIPFPQNMFYPVTETKHLPGPQVAGSGKDFRQDPGVNHSSGKMPGKVAGSGKPMKVKPGFVGG